MQSRGDKRQRNGAIRPCVHASTAVIPSECEGLLDSHCTHSSNKGRSTGRLSHLRIKLRRGESRSLGMTNAFASLPSTHARKSSRRFLSVPPLPQHLDRRSIHGKSN